MSKKSIILSIIFIHLVTGISAFELWNDVSVLSSIDDTPFWLRANRWGENTEEGTQLTFGSGIEQKFEVTDTFQMDTKIDISGRLKEDSDIHIRELYGTVYLYPFYLRGGIDRSILGELPDTSLSSGSMLVSGNAPPLPKIRLATNGFFPVPFTKEQFLVKGGISHGWFLDERYVEKPLLHEKWLYIKLQRERMFSIYLGLVHSALWAGTDPEGRASSGMDAFWRVFFGGKSDEHPELGPLVNLEGDQLGIWDVGAKFVFENFNLNLYTHHFFEDSTGLVKIRNFRDGLWGVNADLFNMVSFIDSVTFELLRTQYQSGAYHDIDGIIFGGRDSYYSHSVYKSGWTHAGWIIGNPFFLTSGEGEDLRIASNRIIANSYGLRGTINPETTYIVKFARALHKHPYTQADAEELVEEDEDAVQYHYYGSISHELTVDDNKLTISLGVGFDHGDLNSFNAGCEIGAVYEY